MVVGAVQRSAADLRIAAVSEPLEVLCRSLEREAELPAPARRAARRRLIDALVRRATLETTAEGATAAPVVDPLVIAGAPGSLAAMRLRDDLTRRGLVSVAGPPSDPDLLEAALSSPSFELDWHVPAYAEWLLGADLTETYRAWSRWAAGTRPGARPLLGSHLHLEHATELSAAMPDATFIRVIADDDVELDEAIRHAVAARRASVGDVDGSTIERYWRWRLDEWRTIATGAAADLVVEAREVRDDLAAVVANVSAVASLCQSG